jgi:GNAT superfamily N-acetyltransferase
MPIIRPIPAAEAAHILAIVNLAAQAYRGVIPADRWHDPYMSADELGREIADGVAFWGCEEDKRLAGVMGMQAVGDATIIRHAYVLPEHQGKGIGAALLAHLRARSRGRILIGTWADAEWAIRFYQRNGFRLVPPHRAPELLRTYWRIPARQIETSVVLADPPVAE